MYCTIYDNDDPYVEVFVPTTYRRSRSGFVFRREFRLSVFSRERSSLSPFFDTLPIVSRRHFHGCPVQLTFDDVSVDSSEYERRRNNLYRVVRRTYDLSVCNHFDYFMTITIDGKKHDRRAVDVLYSKICKYFNNYKQRYAPDLKYLALPELHSDKINYHFHVLVSGVRDCDLSQFNSHVWNWDYFTSNFGFNSLIRTYGKQEHLAKYMTKYLTKNIYMINTFKNLKLLRHSSGLSKPVKTSAFISDLDNFKKVYESRFGVCYRLTLDEYEKCVNNL